MRLMETPGLCYGSDTKVVELPAHGVFLRRRTAAIFRTYVDCWVTNYDSALIGLVGEDKDLVGVRATCDAEWVDFPTLDEAIIYLKLRRGSGR